MTSSSSSPSILKVLHWNTLADCFATPASFPFTNPKYLTWGYRKKLFVSELSHYQADVLCLHEVDQTHFHDFFGPELWKQGYSGLFQKKAQDSQDGTALFFQHHTLVLVKSTSLVYTDSSQVAILAQFLHKATKQHFLVATTHFKAKPGFEEKRLKQAQELVSALQGFSALSRLPILLTGDLNDVPDSLALRYFQDQGKMENLYAAADPEAKDESLVTTFKKREKDQVISRTIDYILYRGFIPYSRIHIPKNLLEWFPEYLPCRIYPSDHLSLVAEFEFPKK